MNIDHSVLEKYIHVLRPIPTRLAPKLDGMQSYRAVLFDVYGTLLVSGAGDIGGGCAPASGADQLGRLLHRYAIDIPAQSLVHRFQAAVKTAHTASRQRGIDWPEVDILQIWQQVLGAADGFRIDKFALEFELLVNPVYPMPGADDLIRALKTANTVMGLISNAQFYTAPLMESLLGCALTDCGFDARLLFYSWVEGYAKPSPVMFGRARRTLREMGISPETVLYVGNDMRNDILPAAAVGFNAALFAGDRRSLRLRKNEDRCRRICPDLIVTDLRQLIACAGGSAP